MWIWKSFSELTTAELYEIIRLRERVFAIEQKCVYLDCDNQDQKAMHLMGWQNGQLASYLRAFGPGIKYAESAFGRVVTAPEFRGSGNGRKIVAEGISQIQREFGSPAIRISAQAYLERFYSDFGFVRVGEEYLEDDIPHIEMLLKSPL